MLVLTRRRGQVVRIGDDVEVVLLAVQGDQVRLGIRAPRDISVVRGELLDQVREENRAAAQAPAMLGKRPAAKEEGALKCPPASADRWSSGARQRPAGCPSERRYGTAQTRS